MSPEPSSSKIGKSVGEKLRAARIAQHLTQSQLAAPDFSVSYISAIERGQIHPSLRALEILAQRLGLSSTQLLPARNQVDDRLNGPLGIAERDDDEIDLAFLEIQVLIREHSIEQALEQLGKIPQKRLKRHQILQYQYLYGWAQLRAAHYQESEYALIEALQIAKELNNQFLTLRILHLLAQTYLGMRNHTQALLSYQRCLHTLETSEQHDPFFAAQLYMQIGQYYTQQAQHNLHNQQEHLEQAITHFYKALETCDIYSTPETIQAAYLEQVRHYCNIDELELAIQYAYKCRYLADATRLKTQRSELYHYLGAVTLKQDASEARTFLDTALQQASKLQETDPLALASLYTTNASWYYAHQQLDEATTYATKAEELAAPFGDTLISAEMHIVLGRIYYARGEAEQGDRHFVTGLEMLEKLGHHEELADEAVQYAQLLEEHGKAHEAFTYFRRAFQSRQKLAK
uniref:HTH cro/C1-type domain-containing protein n=1 Tax=Thermosporothrix sp. COM3 TaxID=2490863 RepID=A0A455SQN5_9CHLR|nr:hypothetical protein KTC_40900 [Thermosporothrix sp. COM3]